MKPFLAEERRATYLRRPSANNHHLATEGSEAAVLRWI
jgi:hypothetical protein